MDRAEGAPDGRPPPGLELRSWRSGPVMAVAVVALFAGFAQFGAVAALGDVARAFGHLHAGQRATVAEQAGLSGTELGIGLAVLRLASLGGLPLTGMADRIGRRRTLVITLALGLAITALAATSQSYWWFVAIFALGRPLLSATGGVAQVSAAELTGTADRAKAIALVAGGYGVGAGLVAIVHSLASKTLGFRGVFALALVPLAFLPLVRRHLVEPDRFRRVADADHEPPVLGPVEAPHRRKLLLVAGLALAVGVITGPANSLVFIYAQNVRRVPGWVTAVMVVAAGVTGLAGLLVGRWTADRVGRRVTVAVAMAGLAGFGVLTYSGSRTALLVGYPLGVLAGGVFAPAGGALANELFPTAVRASVAGWSTAAGILGAVVGLLVFGAVADAGGGFPVAALITFLVALPAVGLLAFLPETRGREPEELWPEDRGAEPAPGP
jgi:MFS family permease